jgi:hypothetical protein
MYGSTRELMSASDYVEKGGLGGLGSEPVLNSSLKRKPGLLNRQRSSQSFEMGSKKIDQVRESIL